MSLNLTVVIQVATTRVSDVVEPSYGDTGSNYTGELCLEPGRGDTGSNYTGELCH